MVKYDILITNGTCVLQNEIKQAHIGSKHGVITVIENLEDVSATRTLDAKGLHVFPGIIDSQVHFREPGLTHKEDIESGSLSALYGGVTTFLEMPNTTPPTITKEDIEEKVQIAKKTSYTNFGFFMGATSQNVDELSRSSTLVGCAGIKVFLGSSTGSLLLFDEEILRNIFNKTKGVIAFHSENEIILNERIAIRDAATSAHSHPDWRNIDSAYVSTEWIASLAKQEKRKIHILHITSKKEMEFLKDNKEYCTVEVTPQHLTLSAPSCYDKLGTFAQMNPPIRDEEQRLGLWDGINNNTVDVIGSDHAPHTKEEKNLTYPASPSGMPGVQTIFSIMLNHYAEKKISLQKVVELLCENPANLYSLNKGRLADGLDSDIVIVDLNQESILRNEDMKTKSGWTPYDGLTVSGKIKTVIVGGHIILQNDKIVSPIKGQPIVRNI